MAKLPKTNSSILGDDDHNEGVKNQVSGNKKCPVDVLEYLIDQNRDSVEGSLYSFDRSITVKAMRNIRNRALQDEIVDKDMYEAERIRWNKMGNDLTVQENIYINHRNSNPLRVEAIGGVEALRGFDSDL